MTSWGDALLIRATNWKSWKLARPAPPPVPPEPGGRVFVTPHDHDRTSIWPAWASSVESPSMPSILRNHFSATSDHSTASPRFVPGNGRHRDRFQGQKGTAA